VPGIPALLARRAECELLVLQLLRPGVVVRRREFDFIAARPEECARRLADARRDAPGLAGRQIEHVDLVEGVSWLPLALKDDALAIGSPVAFARPPAVDREPANTGQEITLLI